jgi:putative ATP-dependent endonuclease of OLD family
MDVVVREHLVLVGPNESGKTSLLRLLDGALSGSIGVLYNLIDVDSLRDPAHPLVVEVAFDSFTSGDKAAFPDQIEVLPDGALRLRLLLRATHDPTEGRVVIERISSSRDSSSRCRRQTWRRSAGPSFLQDGRRTVNLEQAARALCATSLVPSSLVNPLP